MRARALVPSSRVIGTACRSRISGGRGATRWSPVSQRLPRPRFAARSRRRPCRRTARGSPSTGRCCRRLGSPLCQRTPTASQPLRASLPSGRTLRCPMTATCTLASLHPTCARTATASSKPATCSALTRRASSKLRPPQRTVVPDVSHMGDHVSQACNPRPRLTAQMTTRQRLGCYPSTQSAPVLLSLSADRRAGGGQ